MGRELAAGFSACQHNRDPRASIRRIRTWPYSTVLDECRTMTAKTRLELGAMSVLAAMTCGAPAVYGQMATGDSGARPVILTFSYTGELVQNAGGGARPGTTFAGAAGGEVTLLLGRLVGWHGAHLFVFALGTHGGAPSDLLGDVHGVSHLEAPPPCAGPLNEGWAPRT